MYSREGDRRRRITDLLSSNTHVRARHGFWASYLSEIRIKVEHKVITQYEADDEISSWIAYYEYLAYQDITTRLNSRRNAEENLESNIQEKLRSGFRAAVKLADIDNFKQVNDRFEDHTPGDFVLIHAANVFIQGISNTRKKDAGIFDGEVYRYGGEEFVLIYYFKEVASLSQALLWTSTSFAQNVGRRANIRDNGKPITITYSAGITEYQRGEDLISKVIPRADLLMYQAKRRGKNRIISDIPDLPMS